MTINWESQIKKEKLDVKFCSYAYFLVSQVTEPFNYIMYNTPQLVYTYAKLKQSRGC